MNSPLDNTLRVIPIGGLGEFGMNLMVYECGNSLIVVDCGMMFPDASTRGIDVVIPDMTYLFERRDKIAAVFLTHAHEDHIGAIPFLAAEVDVPFYVTPLAEAFVYGKLEEFAMHREVELRRMSPRTTIVAGAFEVEPIHVTHSIVDAVALAIRTPLGVVIHTGDFKLDASPIDRKPSDVERLEQYGREGVLLLTSDSTNAVVEGSSRSESVVGDALERVVSTTAGRVVVTTFASHIHRIQQIVNVARKTKRKVFFVGRSMVENVEISERLGYLSIPREVRPNQKDIEDGGSQIIVVTTGTQGEPNSALARMSIGEHKAMNLRKGDRVVISARTIPGNERAVTRVIDNLFKRGADVVYDEVKDIHVSGHACRDELREMIRLTQPKHFIPIHGTLRNLVRHAELAVDAGVAKDNVHVITNGQVVEIDSVRSHITEERIPAGKIFIDSQAEEVPPLVLRDRQHLAEDGFVIVVVALDTTTGRLLRPPEVITRGFVHVDISGDLLNEVRTLLSETLTARTAAELRDTEQLQEQLRATLKRFFRKTLDRRPMILPVVWEM